MISNNLRPKVSENRVVHKFPINCSTASDIDETYGSMYEAPASSKITTAYVVNTKYPVRYAKLANIIPVDKPFKAAGLTN